MVVDRACVYIVHYTGLVVICYKPDGSMIAIYKHRRGELMFRECV